MVKATDVVNLFEGAVQNAAAGGVKAVEVANLQQFAQLSRKTVEDAERQAAASAVQLSQEARMEHMRAQLTNWVSSRSAITNGTSSCSEALSRRGKVRSRPASS